MKYQVHNSKKMINKKSKFILIIVTTIFVFNVTFVVPNKAEAQTTDFAHMAVTVGKWAWDKLGKLWDTFKKSLTTVAYKKALGTFLDTLAYNAALDLAEGAEGKKPKLFTKDWSSFLRDAGDAATGEFLVDFGATVSSTGIIPGLDICEPRDPNFKVNIVTEKIDIESGKKPSVKCTFSTMASNWGDLGQKYYKDPLSLLSLNGASLAQLGFGKDLKNIDNLAELHANVVRNMLDVTQTDVGTEVQVSESMEKIYQEAVELAEKKRVEDAQKGAGIERSTDPITGASKETGEEAQAQAAKAAGSNKEKESMLQATEDAFANSIGIFQSTLSNAVLKKVNATMFKNLALLAIKGYDWLRLKLFTSGVNDPTGGNQLSIKDYIDQIYSSVKKISYNTNITDIDLVSEMQMTMKDPQSGIPGNLNDSVIDSDFAEALRRAQTGDPITLRQAVEENLISGGKIFGFKDLNNTQIPQQPDLSEGISYDNMKKLRKNRVIPVGWELAALKIFQLAQNGTPICQPGGCTLGDVMNQYNQYGTYKQGELVNGEVRWKTVQDKLCGWRSYASLDLTQAECNKNFLRENPPYLDDIEVKWVGSGGNNQRTGVCYKYRFDNNGFLSGITEESSVVSEEDCNEVSAGEYYEWMEGGCLIIEKGEAPLCGLVNPDWVLKAPSQKCFAKGYYSALEMSESSNRYQECADTRQCLKEDESGRCIGGYGYCLKEKNIWKFKGDVCDKNYNGCITVKDDENKQQSYLMNTLKDCPQEQSGCRKYLSSKTASSTSYIWQLNTGSFYFNENITSCNKSKEGCSNFINIEKGVNLIPNGSFEIDEGRENLIPDGWSMNGFKLSTDSSLLGRYSITPTSGGLIDVIDTIDIEEGGVLGEKISAAIEVPGSGSGTSGTSVDIIGGNETDDGEEYTSSLSMNIKVPGIGNYILSYYVKNIGGDSSVVPYINDRPINDAKFRESGATDWIRKYATYTISNNSVDNIALSIRGRGSFYLDNIQFEFMNQSILESSSSVEQTPASRPQLRPSAYSEYGSVSNVFFKKAPDYYNCKSSNPAPECVNYSKYCSKEDNGCELYRPVNSDASVSAIVTENDICPSECNKFQSYSQLPDYFDKLEAQDANLNIPDPITRNFIADTAKNCSEPSCEEFTNVDAINQGGESQEYYKFLRQCVTPSDVNNEITIYYTWEGSDTAGFQLKTWKLLKSDESEDVEGSNAPCTHISIGAFECSDLSGDISCNPETDLDCRTFYDMNSFSYNRQLSKTIPITDECINLRRTLSNVVYKAVPSMSQRCSKSNVGCIEYKGNNGNNVRNVLTEDFEKGTINPWNFSNELSAYPSTESLQYGGSSMAVYTNGGSEGAAMQFVLYYNLTESGINIIPGKEYTLSFWVKKFSSNNSSDPNLPGGEQEVMNFKNLLYNKAKAQENSSLTFTSPVVNNSEWEFKQLDIILSPANIVQGDQVSLIINIPVITTNAPRNGIFIDNIILKEFQNNFYKIRDSWNTPRVCVDSDSNGSIDNKYLGCQEYKNRDKSSSYLYQFSNICDPENVGCRAVIDTKNSQMPFKQIFNAYCNSTGSASNPECTKNKYYYLNDREEPLLGNNSDSMIKVPEDTIEYIVEDNRYKCANSEKGCQNLAVLDNGGNPSDVFKINNPDNYISDDYFGGQNQTLCLSEYNNCVAMQKLDGGYLFKIHPREKLCEYRKADVSSGLPAGFYKNGTNEACDGLLYNKNYDESMNNIEDTLINNSIFPEFNNSYAAVCPKTQNACTAFIDPQDNLNQIPQTLNFIDTARWGLFNLNTEGTITSTGGSVSPTSSGIQFGVGSGELVRNSFDFSVEQGQTYKLGGIVKFDTSPENKNRFISAYLICKKNKTSNEYYYSAGENKIPYALPDLNSTYFVKENAGNVDKWIYIYGLYTIQPGANFCNVAFYYGGSGGNISVINMSFEKVEGYYTYIDNQNVDRTSCEKPGKENGCVLFHQVTDPTLRWNSDKSYYNSNLATGDLSSVADSNVLLKVIKDRTCGEWATCGSSIKTIDEKTGQERNSCISLVGCNSLSEDNSQCDNFILRNDDVKPLTFDDYQRQMGKNLSWSEMDYSGYSVPGLYPIDSLSAFVVNTTTNDYELGKSVVKKNSSGKNFVYRFGLGVNPVESYYNGNKYLDSQYKACRLYPEKDSPFVWTPAIVSGSTTTQASGDYYYAIPTSLNQRFQGANICQPKLDNDGNIDWSLGLNNDCDCSYTKASYGSSKNLYFPLGYGDIPERIQDEYVEVTTIKKKSQTDFMGWRGFCLEQDNSFLVTPQNTINDGNRYTTRCLSWYPVDTISGEIDSYSVSMESRVPVSSNSSVCLMSEDYVLPEDRIYCAYWSSLNNENSAGFVNANSAQCNVLAMIPQGSKVTAPTTTPQDISLLMNNWIPASNNDNIVLETLPQSGCKIIYGSTWQNWYANNVTNQASYCTSEFTQEKELKFKNEDFNNFYSSSNTSGDLNLIQKIQQLFSLPSGQSIKYYFYDEGVKKTGATVNGDGYQVYGNIKDNELNGQGTAGNLFFGDSDYIGLNSFVATEGNLLGLRLHDRTSETTCGEGAGQKAYRELCIDMDETGNNTQNFHEVLTDCHVDTSGANDSVTFVVMNPKNHNFYINCSDFTTDPPPASESEAVYHSGDGEGGVDDYAADSCSEDDYNDDQIICFGCNSFLCTLNRSYFQVHVSDEQNLIDQILYPSNSYFVKMATSTTACGANCLQNCKTIGLLDGEGENDVIIHSDNYYINSIDPMMNVSGTTTVQGVCLGDLPGGACSKIKVGASELYGGDRIIRVKEISSTVDNFGNNYSLTVPFGSNLSGTLRDPIFVSNVNTYQSPYFGSYSKQQNNLSVAKANLRNIFIKIPELKTWNPVGGSNNDGTWDILSQDTWDLTVSNNITGNLYLNTSSNAPIVKQIIQGGEGNSGITVNNNNSANVYAVKNLKVDISFYAYAQWGRSPIKEIKLDWYGDDSDTLNWYGDDSDTLTLPGPFKNKRAKCVRKCADTFSQITPENWNDGNYCKSDSDCVNDQKCFSYGWGNDPKSCSEDKFNYSFVYVCTPDSNNWSDSCDIAGGEPCCIFNPKVRVTDSWGNSSVSGMSAGKSIIITTNKGMMNIASHQQSTTGNNEADY